MLRSISRTSMLLGQSQPPPCAAHVSCGSLLSVTAGPAHTAAPGAAAAGAWGPCSSPSQHWLLHLHAPPLSCMRALIRVQLVPCLCLHTRSTRLLTAELWPRERRFCGAPRGHINSRVAGRQKHIAAAVHHTFLLLCQHSENTIKPTMPSPSHSMGQPARQGVASLVMGGTIHPYSIHSPPATAVAAAMPPSQQPRVLEHYWQGPPGPSTMLLKCTALPPTSHSHLHSHMNWLVAGFIVFSRLRIVPHLGAGQLQENQRT